MDEVIVSMESNRSRREELKNGRAWLEYEAFEDDERYDVMFYDIEFGDHVADLGWIDLGGRNVEAWWFYGSEQEKEFYDEVRREFEQVVAEESPLYDAYTDIHSADTVSTTVLTKPRVHGDLKAKMGPYEFEQGGWAAELSEFSEGIFDPVLSFRNYQQMWREAEDVFS